MGILGIENRTENWKTARYFAPFFTSDSARRDLAKRLAGESEPEPGKIELFWKGMRDHMHGQGESITEDLKRHYDRRFHDLGKRICEFNKQQSTGHPRLRKACKYDVSTEESQKSLCNNLRNTEIDVVLQTPKHLFIGEAKDESAFGADGRLVLVHQLIRQYVMATILLDCRRCDRKVVPFIVGNSVKSLENTAQVKFMLKQGWLKKKNILSWDDIKNPHKTM